VPYSIAISALGRLCARSSGVLGCYVRSGLAEGTWTPGLSDVDPLVVVGADLELDAERRTARDFSAAYGRLRRVFPMLGELEMVNAQHLGARIGNGADAGAASSWLRLGDVPELGGGTPDATDWRLAALRAYRYHLLPWCWADRSDDPRTPLVLGRAQAKLGRALGLQAEAAPVDRPPHEVLLSALESLSTHLAERPGIERATDVGSDAVQAFETPDVQRGELVDRLPEACLRAIESAVAPTEAPERMYVVLRDDGGNDDRRRCAEAVLECLDCPVIVDRQVFADLLLFVDPLEHFTLLGARTVLHGADPLPLPQRLDDRTLHRSVLGYAVYMLGYPYSGDWCQLSDEKFRNVLLGWFVRTAAYFASGVIESDFERQCDIYRTRFPELAAQIDPETGAGPPELRFSVLRSLAHEIYEGMTMGSDAMARGARSSPN